MARRALALTDESYRAVLDRLAGKRSAADLDAAGRRRVIDHFVSLGWRPARPRREPHGAPAQRRKIAALLKAQDLGAEYGEGIARQMYGKPLQLCGPRELQAVITALVRRGDRQKAGVLV